MMKSIKEYLRAVCGVVKAPLAYVIRKTIIVQTYHDYLTYETPDDEMIANMLHLSSYKNRLQFESSVDKIKVNNIPRK